MIDIVLVPKQRIGALVGKDGAVKKEIEKRAKVKLAVSQEVEIEGEALDVMKAKEIVRAIGRGFTPEKAMNLVSEHYQLYVLSLDGESQNTIKRLLARVIGKAGRTREKIEQDTGCFLSVYGKTVSIIGRYDEIGRAIDAVEGLIEGRTHSFVYGRLEHSKK